MRIPTCTVSSYYSFLLFCCLMCICCIWCENSWGALKWKPGSGAKWSYYDTRHKHLHSSSFLCSSILPCCSALNQPGFASCCFSSPLCVFSLPLLVSPYSLSFSLAPPPERINVTLSCSFSVSRSFPDSVFSFFPNRQPPRSPGKVSLTPQRKSPSSMITRAYHKTLDKCQRGLRRGDQGDIWRRDRPTLTVAHTHSLKRSYINTALGMKQECLNTEEPDIYVHLRPYIFIQ